MKVEPAPGRLILRETGNKGFSVVPAMWSLVVETHFRLGGAHFGNNNSANESQVFPEDAKLIHHHFFAQLSELFET